MKPRILSSARLSLPFAVALAALLAPTAHAVNYYWDNNSNTAGLSTGAGTSGTWNGATNATNTYAAVPVVNLDGTATLVSGGTATTTSDSIYFGTNNLALGATASTIATTGAISINNIVFGTGQTNGVTLSAGATSITLGGTTPTITTNNSTVTDTIGAVIAGTVGMVKGGAGVLSLTGAETYTGVTTISGGGTLQVGDGTSGNLNNTTPSALTFSAGGGTLNVNEANGSSQSMAR